MIWRASRPLVVGFFALAMRLSSGTSSPLPPPPDPPTGVAWDGGATWDSGILWS